MESQVLDKAGAYPIQERLDRLIERSNGANSNRGDLPGEPALSRTS